MSKEVEGQIIMTTFKCRLSLALLSVLLLLYGLSLALLSALLLLYGCIKYMVFIFETIKIILN